MIQKMWAARASVIDTGQYFGAHWKDRLPGNAAQRSKRAEPGTQLVPVAPIPMSRTPYDRGPVDWMARAEAPMGRQVDIYA